MDFRTANRFLILSIVLLAAWLRFYRIDYQSYWNDEGNSLALAGRSAPVILRSAAADIHPPGYYLALKGWRALTGETEFALRGFSALASVALIALLFRLGKEYFDTPAAIAAALLGAVNPFLVYYAQEARMYALLATLGAASFLLFSTWLRSSRPHPPPPSPVEKTQQERGRPFRRWDAGAGIAYCLITAFGLYTHYAFGFVVLAQNLAAFGGLLAHRWGNTRKRLMAWIGLQAITLILYLPWLPIAYRHLTTWPAEREFRPILTALADLTRYLAFGRTIETGQVMLALLLVGAGLLLGLRRGGQTITPLLWLIVPAGLTLAFGLLTEAFSKFLLVAVPPLCLLLGNGLAIGLKAQGLRPKARSRSTRLGPWPLALGIWFLGFGIFYFTYRSLNNLYFNHVYFRDDYREIAQYIERLERPGDAIITISPNQVEAFGYYHRAGSPIFPLPHTRPLDKAETAQALTDIAQGHERIFVLYWGDQQADPEHFVEDWLNTHTFKAGDAWYGQVRLATYAASQPATTVATPLRARFGEHISLEGYTLKSDHLSPGDILQITLFWRTDAALEERYKVFVHLYAAPDQRPVAQQDGEPGGGLVLTTIWKPGDVYEDNHGVFIPPNLPTGKYTLMVGLYNLVDGVRLPITLNGAAIGDRLALGVITLR